jgi:hypothetical protein
MVPAYEAGNERAGMSFEMDYYANPKRGAVPTWSNEMAEASWLHWLTFDGLAAASSVAVPTLLVHSDGCALPDNARTVHERLKGPKELAWMATGTQTDYYDLPEHVAPAAERAAAFFTRTLGATEREIMNADGEADRVRALVTAVAHEIDRKRWTELTNLFAPRVETDYTSLFGGTPQTQTREDLVAGWRAALERVATQHLLGPIDVIVEGSGASASCHVRALHFKAGATGGEHWEVLGHYVLKAEGLSMGWAITRMRLDTFHQTGNRDLLAAAGSE